MLAYNIFQPNLSYNILWYAITIITYYSIILHYVNMFLT